MSTLLLRIIPILLLPVGRVFWYYLCYAFGSNIFNILQYLPRFSCFYFRLSLLIY